LGAFRAGCNCLPGEKLSIPVRDFPPFGSDSDLPNNISLPVDLPEWS